MNDNTNDVSAFCAQATPRSYAMFVDRSGKFEVNEKPGSLVKDDQFLKEQVMLKPYVEGLTKKEAADLKIDIFFKLLVANSNYKEDVAIPFHKAFWGHRAQIGDLNLISGELVGSTIDSRSLNADIIWQSTDSGNVFMTEMQRGYQRYYPQRISYYEGKTRATMAIKGRRWKFNQASVFILGLANFNLHRPDPNDFVYEYVSMNPRFQSDLLTNKDWKMLVDLKKANKVRPAAYAEINKWIYLFNNFQKMDKVPSFMKGGDFDRIIEIANHLNRTKMEELMDCVHKIRQEERASAAEKRGEKRGRSEGRVEMITNYISNQPSGWKTTGAALAAMFSVDEKLVEPLLAE